MESSPDRSLIKAQLAPRAPGLRARVTNRFSAMPGVSGRSAPARRFKDLLRGYVSDAGGIDNCSEVRLGLMRRLAATVVAAEQIEGKLLKVKTSISLRFVNWLQPLCV